MLGTDLAEGIGGYAVHYLFKLRQLLLADAGEQLPAYLHDAILDFVEQRLAGRGQGDDVFSRSGN